MDKIAVLLSTYNGEKYIRCQLDSILNQKISDCELTILIRDDGSTDSTIVILKEFEEKNKNVRVYYGGNEGFVSSFFDLLYEAKRIGFNYYALSDQDDRWDNDKLQIAINKIKDIESPVLYESTVRITDESLHFMKMDQLDKKPITFYNSIIQTFSAGHTYVFNEKLMYEIKSNIDCSQIYAHDSFIHNVAVIKGKVIFDRTPHNDYRQHGNNVIGVTKSKSLISWIKLRIKRIKKGDSKMYAKQIRYYLDYFGDELDPNVKNVIKGFFHYQKNFFTRLFYVFSTKLYRQTFFETISFKLLYLLGGYNISNRSELNEKMGKN